MRVRGGGGGAVSRRSGDGNPVGDGYGGKLSPVAGAGTGIGKQSLAGEFPISFLIRNSAILM